MKNLIYITACVYLIWSPVQTGHTQAIPLAPDTQKKAVVSDLSKNQDSMLQLAKIVDKLSTNKPEPKPKVIYRTKWKTKVERDTVYLPVNWDPHDYEDDPVIHDTVKVLCPPCPEQKKTRVGNLLRKIF